MRKYKVRNGLTGDRRWSCKQYCHHTPKETLEDIAGNEQALDWLIKTVNHPDSKAVAVYGVPGCGKTLTGKVIANVTKRPCLFADLNAVRGQFQGDPACIAEHA